MSRISWIAFLFLGLANLGAKDWKNELSEILEFHCYDCHGDGALIRFSASGLSGGHLREGNTPKPEMYRVRITGYAHQSDEPVAVSVSGVSYAAGSETPQVGFTSFPPGKPTTIEMEGWLEHRYTGLFKTILA